MSRIPERPLFLIDESKHGKILLTAPTGVWIILPVQHPEPQSDFREPRELAVNGSSRLSAGSEPQERAIPMPAPQITEPANVPPDGFRDHRGGVPCAPGNHWPGWSRSRGRSVSEWTPTWEVHDMALGVCSVKQMGTMVSGEPEALSDRLSTIAGEQIATHPVRSGCSRGQEGPVLIEGDARTQNAIANGKPHLPFVLVKFDSEMEALQHAVALQVDRWTTPDGALYRLCGQYDRLMERGGDRRSEGAGSSAPSGAFERKPLKSAKKTTDLRGCNYRLVDKIRKIRHDGTPEIREMVRNDETSINKAYNLVRGMEQVQDEEKSRKKQSAAHVKAARSLLCEDNFASLKALGSDITSLVNLAIEQYLSRAPGGGAH